MERQLATSRNETKQSASPAAAAAAFVTATDRPQTGSVARASDECGDAVLESFRVEPRAQPLEGGSSGSQLQLAGVLLPG
jgi:hypothetical protein